MKWAYLIKILQVLQFLVPRLEIRQCCSESLKSKQDVGLNSVRREIVSYVTIVFYDKVRGRNKAQKVTSFGLLWIFHLKKIQSDTFSQDNNMRQAQPVWRRKSYNFKREAWEENVFFFKYFLNFFLIIWLELSLFDLWLFRSFYLRRSSAENLVEREFLIRILFQVYFDFA